MAKKRLLSIDGGGIRGAVALECMLQAGIKDASDFDAIVCNSAGAIIGCALAQGFTVQEIMNLFIEEGPNIFKKRKGLRARLCLSPKYEIKNLENSLKKYFYDTLLSDLKMPLFVTSTRLNYEDSTSKTMQHMPVVFSSVDSNALSSDVKVYEAACASAAAPTYFDPYKINGRYYVDGGMHSNNPSVVGISELDRLGIESNNISLYSFGTGVYPVKKWPRNAGVVRLASPIIKLFLFGNEENSELIAGKLVEGDMKRYQPRLSCEYDLGDYKSIPEMREDARKYMEGLGA